MKFQAAVAKQWLSTLLLIAGCYATALDPRPDLALPARSIGMPYVWWW
jgi:hypothetical protein